MSRYADRLHRGERWWTAEAVFRLVGLLLLDGCYRLALLAHRMVMAPPPHQASPGEFVTCAAVLLALTSGLALAIEGPGLFRHVPIPRNSIHWEDFK